MAAAAATDICNMSMGMSMSMSHSQGKSKSVSRYRYTQTGKSTAINFNCTLAAFESVNSNRRDSAIFPKIIDYLAFGLAWPFM